jgi:hypothetical protein
MDEVRLEFCEYAANKLKKAGFVLCYTSMKSEACYYKWPGLDYTIRIAAHQFGRTERRSLEDTDRVAASITFGENFRPKSTEALDTVIEQAVGKFFLKERVHGHLQQRKDGIEGHQGGGSGSGEDDPSEGEELPAERTHVAICEAVCR